MPPTGSKTIPISAADSVGNTSTTSVEIELNNPAPLLDPVPPDDNFAGTTLDTGKWITQVSSGGTVKQDERLVLAVESNPPTVSARVMSTWAFTGDFDVQVNFQIGAGWGQPAQEHLDVAVLGVDFNGTDYHITRLRSSNQDCFFAWSNKDTLTGNMATTAVTGKYRLVRTGMTLFMLFDDGKGWQLLDTAAVPSSPANVYIGNGSINSIPGIHDLFRQFQDQFGTDDV